MFDEKYQNADNTEVPYGVSKVEGLEEWLNQRRTNFKFVFTYPNKYDKVMMDTARIWSEMSYCKRRKVGAVLSIDNRILATGYNGTINGTENNCEDNVVICTKCSAELDLSEFETSSYVNMFKENGEADLVKEYRKACKCGEYNIVTDKGNGIEGLSLVTNDFTVHAEQNVIAFCAKEGISTEGATLYVTTSPCKQCSKLIAQSGISRVVYFEKYKDTSGIDMLKKLNIEVVGVCSEK